MKKKKLKKRISAKFRRKTRKKAVKKVLKKKRRFLSHETATIFRPKIRVIGIGGGGGSIVSEIGRSLQKASFVIADTDTRSIKRKAGIKYLYFGQDLTHGLGTGMNPDLARQAAQAEKEKITKILEGQDIVILVASLGGGLGSGASSVFAEISRNLGNITLGIFTSPFRFEGSKKASISNGAIKELRKHLNAIITISNERIFKVVDEKTSITKAFSLVNKNLIESLESLIDLIYNPGIINIDFADLRTTLKGRGMMAFLNTAEASGKSRSEEIVQKILSNPLFNSNIKAEKVLFNIAGADNLSMVEVEKISRSIADLNPKAKIIFGISKSSGNKNKIKTTLLITGESFIAETLEEKPRTELKAQPEPLKKELKNPLAEKIIPAKGKKIKITKVPITKKSASVTIAVSGVKSENKREMIRRNALEVRQEQELEESKKLNQEGEWEIPAFLRKIRFKA